MYTGVSKDLVEDGREIAKEFQTFSISKFTNKNSPCMVIVQELYDGTISSSLVTI